jgi:antitoxin ParD1/3/4
MRHHRQVTYPIDCWLAIFDKSSRIGREEAMPTRNINLTDHLDRFIERGVATGRYGNASEIVREALRLLEQRQQEGARKLQALRKAAREGFDEIDQGQGIVLKDDKALDTFLEDLAPRKNRRRKSG